MSHRGPFQPLPFCDSVGTLTACVLEPSRAGTRYQATHVSTAGQPGLLLNLAAVGALPNPPLQRVSLSQWTKPQVEEGFRGSPSPPPSQLLPLPASRRSRTPATFAASSDVLELRQRPLKPGERGLAD